MSNTTTQNTSTVPNKNNHSTAMISSTISKQPQMPNSIVNVNKTTSNQNDDLDDDGGVHPKKIAKKKQEEIDKKKAKEELKKKKQSIFVQDMDDEDEDGGIINQKTKVEPTKVKKKSKLTLCFHHEDEDENNGVSKNEKKKQALNDKKKHEDEDEDEDGGISKEKILALEKKKQASEEKKKKVKPTTVKKHEDDDEDEDGGVSKEKILALEKKKQELEEKKKNGESKQQKSKKDIPKEKDNSDEDEDGGRIVKTYDSIKKIIPTTQPVLNDSSTKKKSSSDNIDDGGHIVKTYDTVKKIIPSAQPVLHDSSTKKNSSSDNIDDGAMKLPKNKKNTTSTSYNVVHELVPKKIDTIENKKSKIIEKDPVDIVPTVATDTSAPNSPIEKSKNVVFLRRLSYREAQHRSPPAVSHRSKISSSLNNTTTTNDSDNHYSDITNDKIQQAFTNHLYSVVNSSQPSPDKQTISKENHSDTIKIEIDEKIKRRKIARTRWYLAYTLLRNPHLFDLRKNIETRLIFVHSHASIAVDEQLLTSIITDQESQSTEASRLTTNATTTTLQTEPPTILHLPSISNIDGQLQSPAERYISIQAQTMYNTNNQQSDVLQENNISNTNQSIDDCPSTTISDSSTLRTQTNHEHYMRGWYDNEVKKIHKKHPFCYVYGSPSQSSSANRISTITILTPKILSPTTINNDKTQLESNTSDIQSSNITSEVQNVSVSSRNLDQTNEQHQ
ncbi:unnamed protein product [Adineta steineri]|uniref:Uncharacterized protein n=2 Tax=Adineta steineri TaxID=433720 RepID=A0A819RSD3_9BILA|nr:unnamed protein product [Adineta steineri]